MNILKCTRNQKGAVINKSKGRNSVSTCQVMVTRVVGKLV